MKKIALKKNITQQIINNKARFFSIFILIMIGVFAFSGIVMSGINMRLTAQEYVKKYNLSDVKITNNNGLNESDITKLKDIDSVKEVEGVYTYDVLLSDQSTTLRVFSLPEDISKLEVTSGRLPTKDNEVILDEILSNQFKLNDLITFQDDNNPILNQFLLIKKYKIVGFGNNSESFSIIGRGQSKLGNGELSGYGYIYKDNFTLPIYSYLNVDLNTKELAYTDSYNNDVAQSIKKIENSLDDTYQVNDRSILNGYNRYLEMANTIDTLAYIFPLILFGVAALVALTSTTRLIDEERIQIGTLKALGYSNKDIAKKYLVFVSVPAYLGVIIGNIIGMSILPIVIFDTYRQMFIFEKLLLSFNLYYFIFSFLIAFICTTLPAIISIIITLKEKTTTLLRAKVIKSGNTIFLERFTFLWKRLSFNWKVSLRNVFRFKQRMFMSIIGVAGCMALLVTGFGIKDSLDITKIKQYDEIIKYNTTTSYEPMASDTSLNDYYNYLNDNNIPHLKANLNTISYTKDKIKNDLSINIIDQPEDLNQFIKLEYNNKQLKLTDNGIIISKKIADIYKLKIGNDITLNKITYKIDNITDWYIGLEVFISGSYYNKVAAQPIVYNSDLLKLNNSKTLHNDIVNQESIASITKVATGRKIIEKTLNDLNVVIVILIVIASLLAFSVLYTLTSINVAERLRELSTIKVLGFYPREVTLYIYRETNLLLIIGILFGALSGNLLTKYIINSLQADYIYFYPKIQVSNYLLCAMITVLISIVIASFLHKRIKKINMIESLKAVE